MKVRAGNKLVQAVVEIAAGAELDEAMLPAGTRLVLKAENPYTLPKDHPKRKMVDQGKVLFIAQNDGFSIPMVAGKGRWNDGKQYVLDEVFHPIQFVEGEFFADDEKKYKTHLGELTEVEFLRKYLGGLNLREGQTPPFIEATPEWFAENNGEVLHHEPRNEASVIDALMAKGPSEIRKLFTEEEIERLNLKKASKDKLVITFMQEGKTLNP